MNNSIDNDDRLEALRRSGTLRIVQRSEVSSPDRVRQLSNSLGNSLEDDLE